MARIADWPAVVAETLRASHGEPVGIEALHGMSLARVFRVRFAAGSVIVKRSPSANEATFYTRIAPLLRAAGVPIPRLEWAHSIDGSHWIVIEDVPPPQSDWDGGQRLPVERVVAILARLHRATRGQEVDLPGAWSSAWTERHTDAALSALGRTADPALRRSLEALRQEASALEQHWCWISGDASAPNWGQRPDRSLVLFDWEIFRPGVPASDLAPVVAGLGDEAAFRHVASAYVDAWRQFGEELPWPEVELVRAVAVAKAATVVHVLEEYATGGARVPDSLVAELTETFPPWITTLARA